LRRALDLSVPEYQEGSQDFVAAWSTSSGNFQAGFPARVNDLQFLTGPSVADIDGKPGEEVVEGTASLDLAAFDGRGLPPSGWPKLTSDWLVANPSIGSFGVRETDSGARKTVVAATRSGRILAYRTSAPACAAASWPRFHHDNANSGSFDRDAVPPGKPTGLSLSGGALTFDGVGDDLLCGKPTRYEVVTDGRTVGSGVTPGEPGTRQRVSLPSRLGATVGVRAVDDAGNLGPLAVLDRTRCLPRRLAVSRRRIGPARLGGRLSSLTRSYRVVRRRGRTVRFCVRGRGRFLVSTRRGRIDLIVSTARGHRTRRAGPGRRLRRGRLRGARTIARGLLAGRRGRPGRVLYGVRRGRVRYIAVARTAAVTHPRSLRRRLRRLGL
jgi:hypothetical protein